MTQPFVGEIQLFGFNFAPYNWAFCNGATLPLSQYTALFSLLGTQYGGNGTSTFQLPNLTGRTFCSQGSKPGLTPRDIGDTFGTDSVTLDSNTMPSHNHNMMLHYQPTASLRSPTPTTGSHLLVPGQTSPLVQNPTLNNTFAPAMLGPAGQAQPQPHENRQPYLAINYCIALNGVFPTFS